MRTRWITAAILMLTLVSGLLAPVLAQDGTRPFIGIRFEQRADGALIVEIMPGAPAEAAGLRVSDLITAVDGRMISLETPLIALVEGFAPGDVVTLTVDRRGETLNLPLTLGVMPTEEEAPTTEPEAEEGLLRRHISVGGVTFVDLGDRWHVVGLEPDSAAAEAGLTPGDMVVAIDGQPLETYDSGLLATRAAEGGELLLAVRRNGEVRDVLLQLEPGTPVKTTVQRSPVAPEQADPVLPLPQAVPLPQVEAKGYLGVAFIMLNAEMLEALAADETLPFEVPVVEEGALIISVEEDSPAADTGIAMGDVIVALDGDRVDAERTLADRIYAYEEGDTVAIMLWRGAEELALTVTLAARPAALDLPGPLIMPPAADRFAPFVDPDFDLDSFLEANPDFLRDLREQGIAGLLGPRFASPNFDWGAFLNAHPGFMALLERLAAEYGPDELQDLFPEFPWFGEHDPFHHDLDPRLPSDSDNNPA